MDLRRKECEVLDWILLPLEGGGVEFCSEHTRFTKGGGLDCLNKSIHEDFPKLLVCTSYTPTYSFKFCYRITPKVIFWCICRRTINLEP